jgi:2-hydroxychromene-2-carboxylate isomerase
MSATIDFYFDFISPYSYLANMALPRLAQEHAASIRYRPFDLVELMKIVGNRPTSLECRNKGVYVGADLQRWAKRYQVKFAPNPAWPRIDFAELSRAALAAIDDGRGGEYVDAIYRALWGEAIDLSQRSEKLGALARAGFDGALLERAGAGEHFARHKKNTAEAAERGAFGSPTFFVGEQMFFGNDRFDFLTQALRSAA